MSQGPYAHLERQLRNSVTERRGAEAERGGLDTRRPARGRPDPRPRRRRASIWAWVTAGVSLAVVAAVTVVVGQHARSGPSTPGLHERHGTPGSARPVRLGAERVVDVGGTPQALLARGASLWVATPGRVVRLNLRTGQTIAQIPIPGAPVGAALAYGAGSLWLASTGNADLLRISPSTNQVIAKISLGVRRKGTLRSLGGGVAFANHRVWVSRDSNRPRGDVIAISPATDRPAGVPITVGSGPDEVVAGFGSLWVDNTSVIVGNKSDGQTYLAMSRIDAQTRRVRTEPFAGTPAVGFGSLWVQTNACDDDAALLRVDPATGETLARIPIPRVCGVALGDGRIWALSYPKSRSASTFEPINGTAALRQIDPNTNRVIGKPRKLRALQPFPIAASRRQLWIADYQTGRLDHFQLTRP